MSTSSHAVEDPVEELDRLAGELEQATARIEEFGEDDLQELAEVYEAFTGVLDRFEEDVTDDGGDIKTNVRFQSAVAEVVDEIPQGMLLSEVFEECDELLQQRWFHESDFEEVREQLEPVRDLVSRLEDRDEIRKEYREQRRDVRYRVRELTEEIAELERLDRLAGADLDAPTERLREPIETYNDAVTDAFREFTREAAAREVLEFLVAMERYPLVPFESPDEELVEYVREYPPGAEPISRLVEYAGYSHSKLAHYVNDPDRLAHVVGRKQTYLDGLSAEPLTVSWPPPAADELEYRSRELTAAVNRFAPDVVEHLRTVAALGRRSDYGRLRDAAVVRQDLSDEERRRLRTEDIGGELAAVREERARLRAALEEYPER